MLNLARNGKIRYVLLACLLCMGLLCFFLAATSNGSSFMQLKEETRMLYQSEDPLSFRYHFQSENRENIDEASPGNRLVLPHAQLFDIVREVDRDGSGFGVRPTEGEYKPNDFFQMDIDEPGKDDLKDLLFKDTPNIPFDFYYQTLNNPNVKKGCYSFPSFYQFDIHNTYWQTFHLENITMRLFGAYFDNRTSEDKRPVVRIIAMADQLDEAFPESVCQLWFNDSSTIESLAVEVNEVRQMWPTYWGKKEGAFYPQLITCKVPHGKGVPKAVSLVQTNCTEATNGLRVHFDPLSGRKKRFGICVKGLEYPYTDISLRMIEWLELVRSLGVEKVFIYDLAMHPNVRNVLRYYERRGFVELRPLSLADGIPNSKHFQHLAMKKRLFNQIQNEIIPYNDCMYRNLYNFDYLAVLDIDEVIMPQSQSNFSTWHDLMDFAELEAARNHTKCPYGYASVCFQNVYFFQQMKHFDPSIPESLNMLYYTERIEEPSLPGEATKCIHNVSEVLHLHNHLSLGFLKGCSPITLKPSQGLMNHYRHIDKEVLKKNKTTDINILRFKDEMVDRIVNIVKDLGLKDYEWEET